MSLFVIKSLKLFKNRIFDLQGNTSGVGGIGISQLEGSATIYNNLIGDLRCPSCVGTNLAVGMSLNGSMPNTVFNVFYNTIYLNASSTGSVFSASGLKHFSPSNDSTQAKLNLRNNIIVNNSIPNGTAINCAIERWLVTYLDNYALYSNNNLLYAGNSSTNCSIYYGNSISLPMAQATLTPREANSVTELPIFISTNGNHPYFLMPNVTIPTQIESGGAPVAGIFDDCNGTIRNTNTPDIGAWEGYFTIADSTAPTISSINISSGPCNLTGFNVSATIIDPSGVATGSLAPRCYYKINSNPYSSIQGVLASGSSTNGVWNFPITYLAAPGNTVSYFVIAQDNAPLLNVGSMPTNGLIAASVNSISIYPVSPYTVGVLGVLNGTYSVGATGNFTTLTSALQAYNTWCLTGPVTFLLTDPNYSSGETFPLTIKRSAFASTTNSLLIRPTAGNNATITGTTTGAFAVIKCVDAKCVEINGTNLFNTSLKVVNTNTANSAVVWLASTNTISSGNRRIAIKNVFLRGGNSFQSYNGGIVGGMEMSWPNPSNGQDNDSISIVSNTIETVFDGISAGGSTTATAGGIDNWIISNNIIGPPVSGTNCIGNTGISLSAISSTISNNLIQQINANNVDAAGFLISGSNSVVISGNTLTALSSSAATSSYNSIAGISLSFYNNNILVYGNYITDISNNSPSGYYGARGITLYNWYGSSAGIKIQNNMISNIYSKAGNTPPFMPIGIAIDAGGGYEIDNNTVHLASNFYGWGGGLLAPRH